jgi:hypothetical protein
MLVAFATVANMQSARCIRYNYIYWGVDRTLMIDVKLLGPRCRSISFGGDAWPSES